MGKKKNSVDMSGKNNCKVCQKEYKWIQIYPGKKMTKECDCGRSGKIG